MAAWLGSALQMTPGAANAVVKTGTRLREAHPATGAALAAGALSYEHARVIVRTLARVQAAVDAEVADPAVLGEARRP
jgi:hypothetical protein